MNIVTSSNTNNVKTTAQIKRAPPIDLDLFVKSMTDKGYKMSSPWEGQDCLKIGGATYPTLISSDGKVKLAFERNTLFFHNNNVWFGDSSSRPNVIILAGVVTSQESRGQGLASKAVKDFKESALSVGFEVQLQPTPMKSYTEKKKPFLNEKQLRDWYSRQGFNRKNPESGAIMTTKETDKPS